MKLYRLTASIVLFRNNIAELKSVIESFLDTSLSVKLYLIDNSPEPILENLAIDSRVEYFYLNANRGFGAGHNVVLKRLHLLGEYHLILNPDVILEKGTLEKLCEKYGCKPRYW